MSTYRARAVVLRSIRLGEADRIVSLVTEDRGKVRAVVKGVRRTTSRWGGRLEPMAHVQLLCWEGRELDTITQAEVIERYRGVRENLDLLGGALVMLEAVDQLSQEGQIDPRPYRMLTGALRTLEETESALVAGAFLWRLLAAEGSAPVLDRCCSCGSAGPLVAMNLEEGGMLCRSCRRGIAVEPEALSLLQAILGGGLKDALALPPSRASAAVIALGTQAMEAHLERRLRSLHVLGH